jgi:RimJ/RimL family protein N-acetyltransferase
MYKHKNGLCLRKVEREDLSLLLESKQESWFGTHRVAVLNLADQEAWFEATAPRLDCLYLIASDGTERVGLYKLSGIDWISRRYDSGHDVFAPCRGKGNGHRLVEAGVDFGFEVLNMHRIDTEVLENNQASLKTVLKAGFVQEGVRRRAIHKCGRYLDSLVFGILRDEWRDLPRVRAYGGLCNVSYHPKDGSDGITLERNCQASPAGG